MNWVEQLKPDDDVTVEIIYPAEYVQYNISTIQKFTQAVLCYCSAAALLEEDEEEFLICGITVSQVYSLKSVLEKYGIILEHRLLRVDKETWAYFYADVTGLQEKMKNGEL